MKENSLILQFVIKKTGFSLIIANGVDRKGTMKKELLCFLFFKKDTFELHFY